MTERTRFFEFLSIAAVSIGVILYTRWRSKNELKQRRTNKKMGSINIGGIFGMDVGGTLTKIVYFERTSRPGAVLRGERESQSTLTSPSKLKRVCSIDKMDTPAHIAALDEMHKYMVRPHCKIVLTACL